MLLSDSEILPPSLTASLTDEQRQTLLEAPREKRLEVFTSAIGLPEAEALTRLAQATGLDVATNLETDPHSRGLLPARLVHEYQLIPIKFGTDSDLNGNEEIGRAHV